MLVTVKSSPIFVIFELFGISCILCTLCGTRFPCTCYFESDTILVFISACSVGYVRFTGHLFFLHHVNVQCPISGLRDCSNLPFHCCDKYHD